MRRVGCQHTAIASCLARGGHGLCAAPLWPLHVAARGHGGLCCCVLCTCAWCACWWFRACPLRCLGADRTLRALLLSVLLAPPSAAAKARNTSRKVRHGTHNKVVTVRTKTHFYKPKTLALPRNPKVVRKSVRKTEAGLQRMDKYNIIRYPLTTESAMKKIEDNNTLVFIVDKLANKRQIKSAVRGMYEIECEKVNTLIR